MNSKDDRKESSRSLRQLALHARGGLGGQLLALAYGFWAPNKISREIHLKFHDGGTSYRPAALEELFSTPTLKESSITFEQIFEYEKQQYSTSNKSIFGKIYALFRLGLNVFPIQEHPESSADFEDVTIEKLLSTPADVKELSGYTIDYRIFEQTIPYISRCLSESSLPNFLEGAASEDSVSIHWRLGDYLGNDFHGAIPISSLIEALKLVDVSKGTPITIFTDSPEYALNQLQSHNLENSISIQSSDIWTDLFDMSRSKTFIGNHSSISMLAALAIDFNSIESQILFPNKWFVDEKNSNRFYPPYAYQRFSTYEAGF